MSESVAQFQQENQRLAALCERLQTELTDLHDRYNHLSTLEQENERLRCLLAQQSCSQLHSCEQSHEVLQAEVTELRQREQLAQERTSLLERMSFVWQRSAERLSTAANPKAIIVETLRTAAEVLAPLGVKGIGLMRYQPANRTVRVMVHILDDIEQAIAESDLAGDWSVDEPTMVVPWQRIQSEDFIWGLTSDASVLVPQVRHYHEAGGACAVAYVPLRRGEETVGWIGLDLASAVPPTQEQIEMIRALSSHVLLAVEMEQLAEEAKQAAIAHEQEKTAQDRAAELERINTALGASLHELATKKDIDHFLEDLLMVLSQNFGSPNALLFTFDQTENTATIVAAVEAGQVLPNCESSDPYPAIGCEPINIKPLIDYFSTHPRSNC